MSEKRESERDGAKLTRNSGRGWIEKNDAILGPFSIDYKEYTESFGVSRKVWAKCTADALRMRKQPALKLVLSGEGSPVRLWVLGDTMFHEMLAAWQEKYEEGVTQKRIRKTYEDGTVKVTWDPPLKVEVDGD